ncbi:nuclear transport factor 2 family protein [Conexibacter stalactiti]|uniref:Nuclear transport factor 2 family protein n=1 Tax=Conexibacter stalactiti TaxID=1940611 RepID=A0ABU4HWH2_9ACTN|nr:nuclear transport factor 2 family protein [Conexibacter stalactiti]MDW5597626.1 nuclear transport factor 2 family protein [Conexibacter stalactiti]MEC5038268.1 nuclear transport factor 2 family protein [Conexibacter stalactiti]
MSDERTRSGTARLTAAREAGDADAIARLLAEDVVLETPASLGIAAVRGRDAVATVLGGAVAKTYLQAETIVREVLRTIVDGDLSVVKSRLSGRTVEEADYDNEYVCIYVWRDGLVARVEEHPDTLRIVQSGIAKLAKT